MWALRDYNICPIQNSQSQESIILGTIVIYTMLLLLNQRWTTSQGTCPAPRVSEDYYCPAPTIKLITYSHYPLY